MYKKIIQEMAPGFNPRHIEALMREEHRTLDALTKAQFKKEVKLAMAFIREVGIEEAEEIAKSWGM